MIGILDSPYFWWNAGAMFDTLIKYWHLTGDDEYNGIVSQALLAQKGQNDDYLPANQSKSAGNDDQDVWALAALSAAEYGLPEDGTSWVTLAEKAFNEQVLRWDASTCGGGLRWLIFSFQNGYNFKNSASNGHFFQLSSRLARYTGNSTYSDWASKIYDWTTSVGFIDPEFNVFDGADVTTNCSNINKAQFSFYAGLYVNGVANLYNITTGDEQAKWKTALDGLLNQTLSVFFPDGVAVEVACEPGSNCDVDMQSYKGLLAQNLVTTILLAPYTFGTVSHLLTSSAEAAAAACIDINCAFAWKSTETLAIGNLQGTNQTDPVADLGSQLSALSFVQGLLAKEAAPPATAGASDGDNATSSGTISPSSSPTFSGTGSPSGSADAGNAGTSLKGSQTGMGIFTTELLVAFVWLLL